MMPTRGIASTEKDRPPRAAVSCAEGGDPAHRAGTLKPGFAMATDEFGGYGCPGAAPHHLFLQP